MVSAEGGIFDILAGRYNNHVNLDWLKGRSGDMIRVDRLGREAQYISNPCLSACSSIQPSVLTDMMENPVMNGQGQVARFLLSSPPSSSGQRTFYAPSIPTEATNAYCNLVYRLMNMPLDKEAGALPLSSEASGLIARHFDENERFLAGSGQVIAEWSNKYIGTILRIAGLIQLAEGNDRMITGEMMERVIRIGRYYQAHTLYAYAQIGGDLKQQKAAYIVSQLKEKAVTEIRRQDLLQMCRGRFIKKTEDMFPTLDLLGEHGDFRQVQPQRTGVGRPPDIKILVNPEAMAA